MAQNQIEIGVRVNSSTLNSQLRSVGDSFRALENITPFRGLNNNIRNISNRFNAVNRSLSTLTGTFNNVGVVAVASLTAIGVAAGAVTKKVVDLTNETAEMADGIYKASQRMGVSLEFYQKMDSAAQHAGTSIGTMETAMRRMLLKMTQVTDGNKKAAEAFDELGVSIYDTNGDMRDQEAVFKDVLISLASMENATERNAKAQEVLGRNASELAPLFNEGAEAVENYVKANDSAVKVTEELAKSSAKYNDTMQTISETFEKAKNEAIEPLVTAMAEFMTTIQGTDIVEDFASSLTLIITPITKIVEGLNNVAVALTWLKDEAEVEFKMTLIGLDEEALAERRAEILSIARQNIDVPFGVKGRSGIISNIKDSKQQLIWIDEFIKKQEALIKLQQEHQSKNQDNTQSIKDMGASIDYLANSFNNAKMQQQAYLAGMEIFQSGLGDTINFLNKDIKFFQQMEKESYRVLTTWISLGEYGSNEYSSALVKLNNNINDSIIAHKEVNNQLVQEQETLISMNDATDEEIKNQKLVISALKDKADALQTVRGAYIANRQAMINFGEQARQNVVSDIVDEVVADVIAGRATVQDAMLSLGRMDENGESFIDKSLGFDVDEEALDEKIRDGVRLYKQKRDELAFKISNCVNMISLSIFLRTLSIMELE